MDIISNNNNNNNSNNSNNNLNKKLKKILYSNNNDKPLFYDFDLRKKNKALVYILDWLSVLLILVVGGILFLKTPVRGRLFRLDDESIMYPVMDELVPISHLVMIIVIVPLVTMILISLIIKRDWNDFHHSLLGIVQSIALTLLLTGSFKTFIGGIRPCFLEICKPTNESIAAGNPPVGWNNLYYDKSICSEKDEFKINDSLSSYPSGHSSIAATSLGYLALYLYARLKIFHNRGHIFMYVSIISCIIGAGLIGISRVVDYHHIFLNVLCGWLIGLLIAISCYRLNFSSLFGDDNHISIHSNWLLYWDHYHQHGQHSHLSSSSSSTIIIPSSPDLEKNNYSPNTIEMN